MDSYFFDIIKTFGMTEFRKQSAFKLDCENLIQCIGNGQNEQVRDGVSGILARQQSNLQELDWYLNKLKKENTKLYLYVSLRDLLVTLQAGNQTIDPRNFIKICNAVFTDNGMNHLCNGGQNDAQEFLIVMIDYIHDSHSRPLDLRIPDSVIQMPESELEQLEPQKWVEYTLLRDIHRRYAQEYTTLNTDIYFYMMDVITCSGCRHQNLNLNPMNVLCLPVDHLANGGTIYDCMDHYFNTEELDGDYACDKCKNKAHNTITRNILTPPSVLIISLKRFAYDQRTNRMRKINNRVTYPMVLDITKYNPITTSDGKSATYKLISTVNHSGTLDFGHYYSFIYSGSTWYMANDAQMTPTMETAVLNNPSAYILFYERI
jgi:ubiquitin C-terminal hydrolase